MSNSIVVDSALTIDNSFSKKATLIVHATVQKWKSIQIPDSIVSYEQFERDRTRTYDLLVISPKTNTENQCLGGSICKKIHLGNKS